MIDKVYLDTFWLLVCSACVLMMQGGFICLESGQVRSKNSINVAIKNIADFFVASILFWLYGYSIMYGPSEFGFFGDGHFFFGSQAETSYGYANFLFQLMFAGTATTILSGAVAERAKFSSYLICAAIVAGLFYPLIGHWIWAKSDSGEAIGWLAKMGFHDFAGATVVHGVGGWLALAAVLVIGPRKNRFSQQGRLAQFHGHDLPKTALGTFLLFFGWFGFNGGSLGEFNEHVPIILFNTVIAAAFGGLVALGISWVLLPKPNVLWTINGVLAGLVAITAVADVVTLPGVVVVGVSGGFVCVLTILLLERLKIDDGISAIPVHLTPGIVGCLLCPFVANPTLLASDMTTASFFFVQLTGVLATGFLCLGLGYLIFRTINKFYPMRVSPEIEHIGLNVGEHNVKTELFDLVTEMEAQLTSFDFSKPVKVETYDEVGMIALQYNRVLEAFTSEFSKRKIAEQSLAEQMHIDVLTQIPNRRFLDREFSSQWRQCLRDKKPITAVMIDVDQFKPYNDHYGHQEGDQCLFKIAQALKSTLKADHSRITRYGGEEFCAIIPALKDAHLASELEKMRASVVGLKIPHLGVSQRDHVTISLGAATTVPSVWSSWLQLVELADKQLYRAKNAGRNQVASIVSSAEKSQQSLDDVSNSFTRTEFLHRLQDELKYCTEQEFTLCLVICDVTNATTIVEEYGDKGFHYVLKIVADSIRSRLREYDIVGRLDEKTFCFLMRDTSPRVGNIIAGRVYEEIENAPFVFAGANLLVTISNGFVHFDPQDSVLTAAELIEKCQIALAES